jgi:hypothetical protein
MSQPVDAVVFEDEEVVEPDFKNIVKEIEALVAAEKTKETK